MFLKLRIIFDLVVFLLCLLIVFTYYTVTNKSKLEGANYSDIKLKQELIKDPYRHIQIKNSMENAWISFKRYAWLSDELKPISQVGNYWLRMNVTAIDSMDSLYLMQLHQEYEELALFVSNQVNFSHNAKYISVFETTIRILGGLLSAYYIKPDLAIKMKIRDLADRLLSAFEQSPSGIPLSDVKLSEKRAISVGSMFSSTSEATTLQLEFAEVSRITGDLKYKETADRVYEITHSQLQPHLSKLPDETRLLFNQEPPKPAVLAGGGLGLVPIYISPQGHGAFNFHSVISVGARGDSYYEYIIKRAIQECYHSGLCQPDDGPSTKIQPSHQNLSWYNNRTAKNISSSKLLIQNLLTDYLKAVESINKYLLAKVTYNDSRYKDPLDFYYVREIAGDKYVDKMDHLACFLPATLSYGLIHSAQLLRLFPEFALTPDNVSTTPSHFLKTSYYKYIHTSNPITLTASHAVFDHYKQNFPQIKWNLSLHFDLAEKLTNTCYAMYHYMPTGLSPEIVYFTNPNRQFAYKLGPFYIKPTDTHNLLRPETVESLWYMYELTLNPKYREWGWEIYLAFEKYAKIPTGGYSSIYNVLNRQNPYFRDKTWSWHLSSPSQSTAGYIYPSPPSSFHRDLRYHRDKMESFFLAETLKYLYLLFAPHKYENSTSLPNIGSSCGSCCSLKCYVFNTEAHPFPLY